VGGGGSRMTYSSGSITNQSKKRAFKYVMVSQPYRYILYLKQVMAGLPYIKIYFILKHL
jgi:hypothetical protein